MHQMARALDRTVSGASGGSRSMSLGEVSPASQLPASRHTRNAQRAAPAVTTEQLPASQRTQHAALATTTERRRQCAQAATLADSGVTAMRVGSSSLGIGAISSGVQGMAMATRSSKRKLEADAGRDWKLHRGSPASGGLRKRDGRDSGGCSGVSARQLAPDTAMRERQSGSEQNVAPREAAAEAHAEAEAAAAAPGTPKEKWGVQMPSGLDRLSSSRSQCLR